MIHCQECNKDKPKGRLIVTGMDWDYEREVEVITSQEMWCSQCIEATLGIIPWDKD